MKARLFETHRIRRSFSVDPIWDFYTLDTDGNKGKHYQLAVPGCWESHPDLVTYRGKGLYTKTIRMGGTIRLNFKGVSHTADVYVDGEKVSHHYNAYTEFSVVLKNLELKDHIIEVEVDNSFHEESALHISNDYYSYGGITRPVIIEQLNAVYVENLQFTPIREGVKWQGKIKVTVANVSSEPITTTLSVRIGGSSDKKVYLRKELNLAVGQSQLIEEVLAIEDVKTYSLEEPILYYVQADLACNQVLMDDLRDRIGFREIAVEGRDIMMNGKKIIIKGFNRHEDYGSFGCAIPLEAMVRDIHLIESMGANCVRTCHYPNDERFLDLCDERGILVWEEAHARGLDEERMRHPNFERQSEECIREMILNHINHPSIYVWGILNECASDTEFGRRCYVKQFEQIRELDPSRPVTFAALESHMNSGLCLDLVDIVSFNIYPRWYNDTPVSECIESLKAAIEAGEGSGKPLLISEIGAGGIYGYRSREEDKWSEERQASILEEQLRAVLTDRDVSGVIIWQYADCRVDEGWFHVRPKSQNNKGIVDIYRRKKLAFDTVSKAFNA